MVKHQLTFKILLCIIFILIICNSISAEEQSNQNIHEITEFNERVTVVYQDSRDFLWIGTPKGLYRYDGIEYKSFKIDPKNKNSLSDNYISSIIEDKNSNLWIGTRYGGLNKFDLKKETFTTYQNIPGDSLSISNNTITKIIEDADHRIWIGTPTGINIFYPNSNKFQQFFHDPTDSNSIGYGPVTSLLLDKNDLLWIGTKGGGISLPRTIKPGNIVFSHFQNSKAKNSISNNYITTLKEDHNGTIWVGTRRGLNQYSERTNDYTRHFHDKNNPNSIPGNYITSICETPTNTLWIGTNKDLCTIQLQNENQYSAKTTIFKQKKINKEISNLFCDKSGVLWIGAKPDKLLKYSPPKKFIHVVPDNSDFMNNIIFTVSSNDTGRILVGTHSGVYSFNHISKKFTLFPLIDELNNRIKIITKIYQDSKGSVWFGTRRGLYQMNENYKNIVHYYHNPNKIGSISNDFITDIIEDDLGNIWVGTQKGLNRFIRKFNQFDQYIHENGVDSSLCGNSVQCLYKSKSGDIWIGTEQSGLCLLKNTEINKYYPKFINFKNEQNYSGSISCNRITAIHEDKNNNLWIGTDGCGINKFDYSQNRFELFLENDGLTDNCISAILEDDEGYLWISTHNGISKLDIDKQIFHTYNKSDGLNKNYFIQNSFTKTNSGEMIFSNTNGMTIFHPKQIIDNPIPATPIITDFKIFNQSVPINQKFLKRKILTNSITYSDEIKLKYKENVISFNFAALNFISPKNNTFAYFLEGVDKNWHYSKGKHFATYTNLKPKKYNLKIKAANNDGLWSDEIRSLKITVIPPFYMTKIFKFMAIMLFATMLFLVFKYRTRHIEKKKNEFEKQFKEKQESEEQLRGALKEVKKLKDNLHLENIYLHDEIKLNNNFNEIITESKKMNEILKQVELVAESNSTVLILGESGTGKDLLARAIQSISVRKNKPFIKVDCASLPPNLIESELFGHEKGAFTGAINQKNGRFEIANSGTIFLDEIGELPLKLQQKLLRVLQEGKFERLGSTKTLQTDVRIIAATNRDLDEEVSKGKFREDLFYRLNVFPITTPPLRERIEDVPILTKYFVEKYSVKFGKKITNISGQTIEKLMTYSWPGNIRELENIIQRAIIISNNEKLVLGKWFGNTNGQNNKDEYISLDEVQRRHIVKVLDMTKWKVSGDLGAAKILDVNPKTLHSRMKKLNISKNN